MRRRAAVIGTAIATLLVASASAVVADCVPACEPYDSTGEPGFVFALFGALHLFLAVAFVRWWRWRD